MADKMWWPQHQQSSLTPTLSPQQLLAQAQQAHFWLQQARALQQHQALPLIKKMPRGGARGDAKPRGRMTAYAYFVQICREEHKKKHPEENVVFAEFSKKCAERWKTMSDKEKSRFHEMAEKDKKRYDIEMQGYVPVKGEKVRGRKRKHMKDPNAPKRALSAFFMFSKEERPKVRAANPDYTVGDIAKELGRRWSEVDSTAKSKYEGQADKDKQRYDREMAEYKKKSKLGVPAAPVASEDDEDEEEDDEVDDE